MDVKLHVGLEVLYLRQLRQRRSMTTAMSSALLAYFVSKSTNGRTDIIYAKHKVLKVAYQQNRQKPFEPSQPWEPFTGGFPGVLFP